MKNLLKLAICAGILFPVIASAQLINVNKPSLNGPFNTLVAAMAADGAALGVQTPGNPPESNPSPFSEFYWDSSASAWSIGSLSTDDEDISFKLIAVNQQYFYMNGEINIGFVWNENYHVDELLVNVYPKVGPTVPDPRVSLFKYTDNVGGTDDPGDTAQLLPNGGPDLPLRLEFEHIDVTADPFGSVFQENEVRFNMFQQQVWNGSDFVAGNDWFFALNDESGVDADYDDGMFYLTGEISPVPEPSQIAVLAMAGLGGFLFIRRRLAKK